MSLVVYEWKINAYIWHIDLLIPIIHNASLCTTIVSLIHDYNTVFMINDLLKVECSISEIFLKGNQIGIYKITLQI